MHNKFPFTFIYSINKYLLKVLHVPAPTLGMEIIRTSFCKVYILVVKADSKERKRIKGILSEHNVTLRDIEQGGGMGCASHSVYGMGRF